MSEALIDRLAADLRPSHGRALARRLVTGWAVGLAASALLIVGLVGARRDFAAAAGERMFWMKLGYPMLLAVLALRACGPLARPFGAGRGRLAWLAWPIVLVGLLAWSALATAPATARAGLVAGHSAAACTGLILAASAPPFAGLLWAFRTLAPVRLRLAGFAAGLAAGGAGAAAYALHCEETAAPFLAAWYSLGVLGAGVIGALAGPRLLRW